MTRIPSGLPEGILHGKWGFSELFGGCDNPLPLPLGEVPQCAHWGGEGNYVPAKQVQ